MALADIDLHIRSGETIGIIGGTGSSKSTLVQLISRLYDVTEGAVQGGRRGCAQVRSGGAAQPGGRGAAEERAVFSGTIKENLRWGNPDATDEEMEEACRLAQADEFIQQFPDKYDTHGSSRAAPMFPAGRSSACASRARC